MMREWGVEPVEEWRCFYRDISIVVAVNETIERGVVEGVISNLLSNIFTGHPSTAQYWEAVSFGVL